MPQQDQVALVSVGENDAIIDYLTPAKSVAYSIENACHKLLQAGAC